MADNEKIDIHIDHYVAQPGGVGYYYAVMPSPELFGPFDTPADAKTAALAAVEQSVAQALASALFGE
ncbi:MULTISPECIES: hypothetical protein [unclassified Ensifer]|uniref:hypothetical protein n=1 Tax=unclassified Ensifer TaxID=2633371 RepID=UPI0008131E88|nr:MULTISPECIES: hypothetical protein [unclassified Ensifer]OCP21986.1 hypothetical protein BC361_25805 [Ensifer sp. LC54]OCP23234.1 hypothetical protein BC363_24960 [Ensifer sp. LC384]